MESISTVNASHATGVDGTAKNSKILFFINFFLNTKSIGLYAMGVRLYYEGFPCTVKYRQLNRLRMKVTPV